MTTLYTEAIGNAICQRIALGETLTAICKEEGMPAIGTIYAWRRKEELMVGDLAFNNAYQRARQDQALFFSDKAVDLSSNLKLTGDRTDNARIQKTRLECDVLKWHCSKMYPQMFGDKVTHEGNKDEPIRLTIVNFGDEK